MRQRSAEGAAQFSVMILTCVVAMHILTAQPNPYVGSQACASCHQLEAERQLASNMAATLVPPQRHPLFERFKIEAARAETLHYWFDWNGQQFQAIVAASDGQMRIPVQWAFGAGLHAVTFVSVLGEGRYLEHRLSYYPRAGRLDFTPGRAALKFENLIDAAGHVNGRGDAFRCISCHSTGTRDDPSRDDIAMGEPGVRCEACHGPGRLHVEAARLGNWSEVRRSIQNPKRWSGSQVVALCGNCHRQPPRDASRVDWKDPANTRFQPVGLSQSQCYAKSSRTFSCVTCHDPHSNARRNDPQFYAKVCRSCHNSAENRPAELCFADKQACVRCHMPEVQGFPHISFTNHWIGIYGKDSRLVPVSR